MLNSAYETLYDEHKKYLYDRVGIEKMNDPNVYHEFDFNQLKGPELKIKVFLELKDFYLGK
jgi:DnaJ-class molecular chaperone